MQVVTILLEQQGLPLLLFVVLDIFPCAAIVHL